MKPRLAVLSAVLPYPPVGGQQQRVANKLRAFGEKFDLTFITTAPARRCHVIEEKLLDYCDASVLLPVPDLSHPWNRAWHGTRGMAYAFLKGLKRSNYWVSEVAFTPEHLELLQQLSSFDVVVYEYWHAYKTVSLFQDTGAFCVLDMHNVLWQSYDRQLRAKHLPDTVREWRVGRYRSQEEAAWKVFDGLITINAAEHAYVKEKLSQKPLFYAPMGIDLSDWPYSWQPAFPPRIGYYGGLASPHNQRDALYCYENIMPRLWDRYPETELWLVGSKPSAKLLNLPQLDSRVRVTGFVEDVAGILNTLSLVLCPWQGRYGFRSRLIEVMALGVPVITTADAVYGMDLVSEKGLFLCDQSEMAGIALQLLDEHSMLDQQSRWAREQVEHQYGYAATYLQLATQLLEELDHSRYLKRTS